MWETMLLENLLCWICWEVENIFCFVHYQNSRSSVPVHEYFTPILVLALYVWLICGQCYSCTWKWHFQNNNLAPVYNITLFVLGQFHFVFQLPPCKTNLVSRFVSLCLLSLWLGMYSELNPLLCITSVLSLLLVLFHNTLPQQPCRYTLCTWPCCVHNLDLVATSVKITAA